MSSLNKVLLIGYLGEDPEVRYTPDGAPVATFSLATGEQWTDKSGQRQEHTEWHAVVAWNKLAEIVQRYTNKGKQVYVEGRLKTREWNDRDGNKRRTTEVIASSIILIGGGRGQQGGERESGGSCGKPALASEPEGPSSGTTDDDIPF